MRILSAIALAAACLFAPAALAQSSACDKPVAEMTPDEYVTCVSIGGVKALAPAPVETSSITPSGGDAPLAAGRGVTAAGTSESDACSKAKARAGGTARGSCNCSQKSSGRYECTVATANVIGN